MTAGSSESTAQSGLHSTTTIDCSSQHSRKCAELSCRRCSGDSRPRQCVTAESQKRRTSGGGGRGDSSQHRARATRRTEATSARCTGRLQQQLSRAEKQCAATRVVGSQASLLCVSLSLALLFLPLKQRCVCRATVS